MERTAAADTVLNNVRPSPMVGCSDALVFCRSWLETTYAATAVYVKEGEWRLRIVVFPIESRMKEMTKEERMISVESICYRDN